MYQRQRYPAGEQNFQKIRETEKVYIDKTNLIYDIVNNYSYVFLSRPRRFGKSLLLSTLQAFFEGKKELFNDLSISKLEKDWKTYPVIHLELSRFNPNSEKSLESLIHRQFNEWEEIFEIKNNDYELSQRFENIIKRAKKQTGENVVILIDEYDNPLINTLHKPEIHEFNRELLKSIYSNLKALDGYIRFAMLTGVTRFSKMTIFSGLNNLTDITFHDKYSAICGFTEMEIKEKLWPGVIYLGENNGWTPEEAMQKLKEEYDGYHFSKKSPDIYNPYSVLRALEKEEIEAFWVDTATPEFLVRKLRETDEPLSEIFNESADSETLAEPDTAFSSPLALLFQTGYLTIKGYDPDNREYKLGVPNKEVHRGLFTSLLSYMLEKDRRRSKNDVREMEKFLKDGEPDKFLIKLQSFLAGVPNSIMPKYPEAYFEHALYIILQVMSVKSRVEVETSDGRIDLLVETEGYIYIVEIKLDGSSEKAIKQIEEKKYGLPYKTDGRKVFNIGVNFSSKTRNITDWIIKDK